MRSSDAFLQSYQSATVNKGKQRVDKGALQLPETPLYQLCPSEMLVLSSPAQPYTTQLYPTLSRELFFSLSHL